jgi:hypothetical protein
MQTQIALSTMEAKYIALSQSMRDMIPVREILKEICCMVFGDPEYTPKCKTHYKAFKDATPGEGIIPQSTVYEDNQACLKFAQMSKLSPRTKHIAVPFHFFRSKCINLEIEIESIPTTSQLSDQLIKGLPQESFEKVRLVLMGW